MTTTQNTTAEAIERTATLINRWVRVSNFHPAEQDAILCVAADALVLLEEDGPQSLADMRDVVAGDLESTVWRTLAAFACRALTLAEGAQLRRNRPANPQRHRTVHVLAA
ncbi:MAG: hypothetical protein JWO67_154 [Streptosporangiaceae bacterium]|nr:hypothetical protein [Streptosporangiaceae bacterium]